MMKSARWIALFLAVLLAGVADPVLAQNTNQTRLLPVMRQLEERLKPLAVGTKDLDPEAAIRDLGVLLTEAEGRNNKLEQMVVRTVRANHAGRLKRYKEAIDDLDKALALEAGYAFPYYLRGSYRGASGDRDAGIADLDKALILAPAYRPSQMTRAGLQEGARRFDRAAEDYASLLHSLPANDDIRYRYALALSHAGDKAKALVEIQTLLVKSPDNRVLLIDRALIFEGLGRHEAALDDLSRVIAMGDEKGYGYAQRARMQFAQGNFAEAERDGITAFTRGLETGLPPRLAAVLIELARLRMGRSDPGDLARRHELAFTADWQNEIAAYVGGKMQSDELLQKAMTGADEAVRSERLCQAHFYIGQVRLGRGDLKAAQGAFEASLATNVLWFPEHGMARRELERLGKS